MPGTGAMASCMVCGRAQSEDIALCCVLWVPVGTTMLVRVHIDTVSFDQIIPLRYCGDIKHVWLCIQCTSELTSVLCALSSTEFTLPSECIYQVYQELVRLDEQELNNKYKIGVLYCKKGQTTEEEMYNNGEEIVALLQCAGCLAAHDPGVERWSTCVGVLQRSLHVPCTLGLVVSHVSCIG